MSGNAGRADGRAVFARPVDPTKPRASGENTRHSSGPSDIAFCPFARSQRADKARAPNHGKAVGAPVLKLWNESRTNRARIADSVVVGIRSRPHLVAWPLHATKSCKAIETAGLSMLRRINGKA